MFMEKVYLICIDYLIFMFYIIKLMENNILYFVDLCTSFSMGCTSFYTIKTILMNRCDQSIANWLLWTYKNDTSIQFVQFFMWRFYFWKNKIKARAKLTDLAVVILQYNNHIKVWFSAASCNTMIVLFSM